MYSDGAAVGPSREKRATRMMGRDGLDTLRNGPEMEKRRSMADGALARLTLARPVSNKRDLNTALRGVR